MERGRVIDGSVEEGGGVVRGASDVAWWKEM